jgi:hypothetical protein
MSAEEEVEEHVHQAHEPFDKLVAGSMAIIAALLAIVSVLGTHYNTEKLLTQQLASDEWAYYQAKDIRRYLAQVEQDSLAEMRAAPTAVQKYAQDANKYKVQTAQIQDKAKDYEKERDRLGQKAERFHFGEVFLEVAIVFSSLAILTKRRPIYFGGAALAAIGIVLAVTGYWA